jgi:pyrimidine operon attenuation protein/uracil phosphoribosyltransferase
MVEKEYSFKKISDSRDIKKMLEQIASEILDWNGGCENLALIGIIKVGDVLAKRLRDIIKKREGEKIPLGTMDITLYRDDINTVETLPTIHSTEIPFDINHKNIVLVDDVINTGRTIRAAIDQIVDYGRPRTIKLAVLVDRGNREFPIQPDFVGTTIDTTKEERIEVQISDTPDKDCIRLGVLSDE